MNIDQLKSNVERIFFATFEDAKVINDESYELTLFSDKHHCEVTITKSSVVCVTYFYPNDYDYSQCSFDDELQFRNNDTYKTTFEQFLLDIKSYRS